jgi:hypothetical protein
LNSRLPDHGLIPTRSYPKEYPVYAFLIQADKRRQMPVAKHVPQVV